MHLISKSEACAEKQNGDAFYYLLHQSLINHLNLLSNYRENFDIDSIKLIEASPCTSTGLERERIERIKELDENQLKKN